MTKTLRVSAPKGEGSLELCSTGFSPEAAGAALCALPQGLVQYRFVLQLLQRGYSPAAVDLKFYDAFTRRLNRRWLETAARRVQRSPLTKRLLEAEEERVLTAGLARKSERVRRLEEYVEGIELAAFINPGKVGIEYRRGIEQIKLEVEGLGMDVTIHPGDAWANLLKEIREYAVKLGSAHAGARVPDAPSPGGDTE